MRRDRSFNPNMTYDVQNGGPMVFREKQLSILASLIGWLTVLAFHPAADATKDFNHFNGTFEYTHGAAEEQGRLDAIEGVVQQLNFIIRAYARKRISSRLKPYDKILFQFDGDVLTTRFDQHPTRETPLDGTIVNFKDRKGRDAFIQRTRKNKQIHERGGRDGNVRTSVYRFSQDGQTLFVDVTIESVRLPDAIRYRLTYKKK